MVHTMMLFSHRWVQYVELQGFLVSQEEKECWHHLWTYVAYKIKIFIVLIFLLVFDINKLQK